MVKATLHGPISYSSSSIEIKLYVDAGAQKRPIS